MNPGYAGRSNLPDNLKKLFRSISMTRPDQELIAPVLLFSKGFRSAEFLARKIVPFFKLCGEQLSSQPHYDFGLRALNSVLASAGSLKRSLAGDSDAAPIQTLEQQLMIQSVSETIVPKLVADDVPLLTRSVHDVFAPMTGLTPSRVVFSRMSSRARTMCLSTWTACANKSTKSARSAVSSRVTAGSLRFCSYTKFRRFSMVS